MVASSALDEGEMPPPVETLPAPGSSGVSAAGAADAEDGGAEAIVVEVVEESATLPNGAGYAALTALVAAGAVEAEVVVVVVE